MQTIDKNIPIPARNGGRGRTYPFHNMEVGDSFFTTRMRQARGAAYQHGNIHCMKFVSRRQTSKEGKVGVRIWRVK
jgi:hypothetical protein